MLPVSTLACDGQPAANGALHQAIAAQMACTPQVDQPLLLPCSQNFRPGVMENWQVGVGLWLQLL